MKATMDFARVSDITIKLDSHKDALTACLTELHKAEPNIAKRLVFQAEKEKLMVAISNIEKCSSNMGELATAAKSSLTEYRNCENRLCSTNNGILQGLAGGGGGGRFDTDNGEFVKTGYEVGSALSKTFPEQMVVLTTLFPEFLDRFDKNIDGLKDYAGLYDLFHDSKNAELLYQGMKDVGDTPFMKTAGYILDGKDLVEALESGDIDKLESLCEKYLKKGVKAGTKISGPTASIYTDLGWYIGKNAIEEFKEILENPSLGAICYGAVKVYGKSLFQTGTDLAEDALDFFLGLGGGEVDKNDFQQAMDYLWNHPTDALAATGEVIAGGAEKIGKAVLKGTKWLTSWIKW